MSDNEDHGVEATDHDVVDLNEELESTTTRTLLDPELDLSLVGEDADPPCVIPADIPLRFHTFINFDTSPWATVAQDCTLLIASHILSGRFPLRTLADTDLILRVEAVSTVINNISIRHQRIGMPVPNDIPDFDNIASQPDSVAFMVVRGLQTIPYAYLGKVWRAVNQILYSSDPTIASDPLYSSLFYLSTYVTPESCSLVEAQTTWDPSHGYPFWHVMQGSTVTGTPRPVSWFENTPFKRILKALLSDTHCPCCIVVPDIARVPEHYDDIMLIDPLRICVVHKISFALAWVVVELRAKALSCYSFKDTPILTTDRVLCVAREFEIIHDFLDWVSTERNSDRGTGFAKLCDAVAVFVF